MYAIILTISAIASIAIAFNLWQKITNHNLRIRNKYLEDINTALNEEVSERANELCFVIKSTPYDYTIVGEFDLPRFAVYALKEDDEQYQILVKAFPFDAYDDNDQAYALRCAEELLEKLQEEQI